MHLVDSDQTNLLSFRLCTNHVIVWTKYSKDHVIYCPLTWFLLKILSIESSTNLAYNKTLKEECFKEFKIVIMLGKHMLFTPTI